jgi:hypothetical protein
MKTKLAFLTLGLLFGCLFSGAKERSTSLISGQSLTELGQYSIDTSTEPLTIAGETLKTYRLNYSNCNSPVLIGVKKTKQCLDFIIHTDNFEVEYVCKDHVFGVKRISKEYQRVSTETINDWMNKSQFYAQRVISQNPKTETELLGLIACYFPSLIKEEKLTGL